MLKIIPAVLYFLVGLISLSMALKCFFARQYLPFHEQAAGTPWQKIDDRLQVVILSFLRLGGLGFLVVSILLLVCSIVNCFVAPDTFYKYLIPGIALLFCTGLFINNYLLYRKTKADAPWKESVYAMGVIVAGIIISAFAG